MLSSFKYLVVGTPDVYLFTCIANRGKCIKMFKLNFMYTSQGGIS